MNVMKEQRRIFQLVIVLAVFSFSMFGCTVTETINDFLSSTTPGLWYTEDGLIKEEYKSNVFVALNFDNLKTDLAQGQGEYLTSLTALLHVPPEHQSQFLALVQQRYPDLAQEQHHLGMTRTLIALSKPFREASGG